MKTEEILDALVLAGMKVEEIVIWLESRQNTIKNNVLSVGIVASIFPVVYKKGMKFEILPHLDLSRRTEVWGFEIFPGIFLAKKCGPDNNIRNTTRDDVSSFSNKMFFKDKKGCLPYASILKEKDNEVLRENIKAMDKFLCEHDIDAERQSANDNNYIGLVWCADASSMFCCTRFDLAYGSSNTCNIKEESASCRVVVSFQ